MNEWMNRIDQKAHSKISDNDKDDDIVRINSVTCLIFLTFFSDILVPFFVVALISVFSR